MANRRGPVIAVSITGDSSSFDKAAKKAGGSSSRLKDNLLANLGAKAITGGLSLIGDAIGEAFNFAAGGLDKFDALGDSMALLESNTKGLSRVVDGLDLTKMGFDKIETAGAASDIANMAKALGLTDKQVAKIAPDLTTAAAGLSAMTGRDAATSGDLIAKALRGAKGALGELGIEFKKGSTPMQRYQQIMKKYGPLAAEVATGARSAADEQAAFDANMTNLQTTMGGFLSSAITPLIAGLNDTLFPALSALATEHGPAIAGVFSKIGEVFGKVVDFIINNVVPVVLEMAKAWGEALAPVLDEIMGLIGDLMPVFKTLFDFFTSTIVPILRDTLIPILGTLLEAFFKIMRIVAGALKDAFKAIEPVLKTVGDILGQVFQIVSDVINKIASAPIIKDFLGFIGGGNGGGGGGGGGGGTFAAGTLGISPMAAPAPVTINIRTGVGDPVRIGREVSRTLAAYRVRGGTI